MVGIVDVIAGAKAYGIFEFFLPFILMFAILYGLLIKTKIFGEDGGKPTKFSKTISMVISLVAASYVMIYNPVGMGVTLSTFFANFFGQTLVLIMSLLGFLMVLYLMMNVLSPEEKEPKWDFKKWAWAVLAIVVVLGIGVFISSGGAAIFPGINLPFSIELPNPETTALIVVIVLTGLVIYFLAKGEDGKDNEKGLFLSKK